MNNKFLAGVCCAALLGLCVAALPPGVTGKVIHQYPQNPSPPGTFMILEDPGDGNYQQSTLNQVFNTFVVNGFLPTINGNGTNENFWGSTFFDVVTNTSLFAYRLFVPFTNQMAVTDGNGMLVGGGPQTWTNDANVGVHLANGVTNGGSLFLGLNPSLPDTNSINALIYSKVGTPIDLVVYQEGTNLGAVGLEIDLRGAQQSPSGGGVTQEGDITAFLARNIATNLDSAGWLYFEDIAMGISGTANAGSQHGHGAAGGAQGNAFSLVPHQVGGTFLSDGRQNAQTNIGVSGVAFDESFTGGATVGAYFETAHSYPADPILENAVEILDNRDSVNPIAVWRTNQVKFGGIDSSGNVTATSFSGSGPSLTNLTYVYKTNLITGTTLTFGQAYRTNLAGNLTISALTINNHAFYETLILWTTNSGAVDRTVTWPAGVIGPVGTGTPSVMTSTNKTLTRYIAEHYGDSDITVSKTDFGP